MNSEPFHIVSRDLVCVYICTLDRLEDRKWCGVIGSLPANQVVVVSIHLLKALDTKGAIHSTKISGNFGPKLNGSVRSNRKSFEKTGPPFEVVLFSRSDRSECWLNGSRPRLRFY